MLDICENTFGETCFQKHKSTDTRPYKEEHILRRMCALKNVFHQEMS